MILVSMIFVNAGPKNHLCTKVDRTHLWIIMLTTQCPIHVQSEIFFDGKLKGFKTESK